MRVVVKILRFLLLPVSVIYAIVTGIRNILFNLSVGKFKQRSFEVPIISLGNITVGGTGKTPHTEWLINKLKDKYRVALLSRGYGRNTKGAFIATPQSTSHQIGDEPAQIYRKYNAQIQVAVAEKRCEGVELLLSNKENDLIPEIIVLDDAFQHRYVKPDVNILIVDYNRPLWNDFTMPTGNLRELPCGAKRANFAVVSKCPADISTAQKEVFKTWFNKRFGLSVFFTSVKYMKPTFLDGNMLNIDSLVDYKVIALSGIAQPKPFYNYVDEICGHVQQMTFPDHYNYTDSDIETISAKLKDLSNNSEDRTLLLTTEKDAMRLKDIIKPNDWLYNNIAYIPIGVEVLDGKDEEMINKILSYVTTNK